LGPSSLQGLSPWDVFSQIFEVAKACSPEIQCCDLDFCPAPSSQDAKLLTLMVTAVEVAFNLLIANEFLLVSAYVHVVG